MAVHLPPCLTGETQVWGRCVPNQFAPIIQEVLTQIVERLTAIMGDLPARAQGFVQNIIDRINAWLHPTTTAYTYTGY